jgi:hypothetical protein
MGCSNAYVLLLAAPGVQFRPGVLQILQTHDVVPLQHTSGFVAANEHGLGFWYSGILNHDPYTAASDVMEYHLRMRSDILVNMLRCVRFVIVAAAFTAVMYGDDITIPLDDGSIVVSAAFHETTELAYKVVYPDIPVYDLVYRIKNQTSSSWRIVRLRFDFGALCAGRPKQWSIPITVRPLPYNLFETGTQVVSSSSKEVKLGGEVALPLPEGVKGCSVEIVKIVLLSAESEKTTIVGTNTEPLDLTNQLKAIQAPKDVEAQEQAKKDAAEAVRQRRLAAERRKKGAEDQARYAKAEAEEQAKVAEERQKIRAACAIIYQSTVDKKISNLTVREEQQIRACQALGLYHPQ